MCRLKFAADTNVFLQFPQGKVWAVRETFSRASAMVRLPCRVLETLGMVEFVVAAEVEAKVPAEEAEVAVEEVLMVEVAGLAEVSWSRGCNAHCPMWIPRVALDWKLFLQ